MKREEKILVWGDNIPGNSCHRKELDMRARKNPKISIAGIIRFLYGIHGRKPKNSRKWIDSFTWAAEITRGKAKETYEDEPYLIPYLAKGSDSAVIVVPGGGYAYLSMDMEEEEKQTEGALAAKALNEAGINAFVLWYRFNPYKHPIPLLDFQRAVRWLKFHAAEYGINPEKIGAVGFSAGGFQVGSLMNILKDRPVRDILDELGSGPVAYQKDEIDDVSASISLAGLMYPALNYRNNVSMMYASFPEECVRNDQLRNELIEKYDCVQQMGMDLPPHYIAYGLKDHLVKCTESQKYVKKLKEMGIHYVCKEIKNGEHGLSSCPSLRNEFAQWAAEIFKEI